MAHEGAKRGMTGIALGKGPSFADIDLAAQVGYSAAGGIALGLSGIKRIMDEFAITSECGRGTAVTVTKWRRR